MQRLGLQLAAATTGILRGLPGPGPAAPGAIGAGGIPLPGAADSADVHENGRLGWQMRHLPVSCGLQLKGKMGESA
ncbi:hypothetical protein GCM10010278_07160 [Streptomyces melanogenes]|nr:hypothetical protein GCM10010278_07160 [Streptomyces melanogenes]